MFDAPYSTFKDDVERAPKPALATLADIDVKVSRVRAAIATDAEALKKLANEHADLQARLVAEKYATLYFQPVELDGSKYNGLHINIPHDIQDKVIRERIDLLAKNIVERIEALRKWQEIFDAFYAAFEEKVADKIPKPDA